MEVNHLPYYDSSDNPTGCCPRFHPEGWDKQQLHFKHKPFIRVETRSIFHIPINMGDIFSKTFKEIEKAGANSDQDFIILSNDLSPWKTEHYFSVTKEVPGEPMEYLDGDYETEVFEGPYKDAPKWYKTMEDHLKKKGKNPQQIYFFYTTCPKCAKYYGKNYVVGVAKTA